jgi:hypothetical protein
MSSFHVDGRITIKMEYELAIRLGEYITKTRPADKQIAAFAWKLARLAEEEQGETGEDWNEPAIPVAREEKPGFNGWSRPEPGPAPVVKTNMHDKIAMARSPEKVRWGYK